VFVLLYSREKSIADGIKRAYIFSFRVKPQYRKIGLGTSIMKFTEENLRNRGYSEIRLNVAKENLEALHLYKTLGYRIIGSDPGIWNYQDHEGVWQSVREPAWQMLKLLK
jgi:ribosomal protein S18 acetylase RimI-like enzyme